MRFQLSPVTSENVLQVIKNLRSDCSMGANQIPTRFIKMVAECLAVPLTSIINNCINLVPRSHSVTGDVRSGKVRQYTIFHWPLKKGCGNAIYAPIGLFRGALNEGLVFASSCAVLNKCQLCGGKLCFFLVLKA